jgi:hypothetical protein
LVDGSNEAERASFPRGEKREEMKYSALMLKWRLARLLYCPASKFKPTPARPAPQLQSSDSFAVGVIRAGFLLPVTRP